MIASSDPVTAGVIRTAGKDGFDKGAQHFLTRYILERLLRERFPEADPLCFPREDPVPEEKAYLPAAAGDAVYRDAVRLGPVRVDKDPLGKPFALFLPGTDISLTHCRYAAAAAAGSGTCGIDAERRFGWNLKLAGRILHPAERSMLEKASLSEREMGDFLGKIWSRKEAYVKCLGTGLASDFRSFCVLGKDTGILERQTCGEEVWIEGEKWFFTEQQDELITLCICSCQKHIRIHTIML